LKDDAVVGQTAAESLSGEAAVDVEIGVGIDVDDAELPVGSLAQVDPEESATAQSSTGFPGQFDGRGALRVVVPAGAGFDGIGGVLPVPFGVVGQEGGKIPVEAVIDDGRRQGFVGIVADEGDVELPPGKKFFDKDPLRKSGQFGIQGRGQGGCRCHQCRIVDADAAVFAAGLEEERRPGKMVPRQSLEIFNAEGPAARDGKAPLGQPPARPLLVETEGEAFRPVAGKGDVHFFQEGGEGAFLRGFVAEAFEEVENAARRLFVEAAEEGVDIFHLRTGDVKRPAEKAAAFQALQNKTAAAQDIDDVDAGCLLQGRRDEDGSLPFHGVISRSRHRSSVGRRRR